jgi:hypothetical protein
MSIFFKSKEEKFWQWFSQYQNRYFHFENEQNNLFGELKKQLDKIDTNLTFEFSGAIKDNTREFIISADGIKSSFPSVIKLVEKAPKFEQWKIIAFRQPYDCGAIRFPDVELKREDVFFRYAKDNGKVGIELHIRNFTQIEKSKEIIFIMLDALLGEYDTEMSISWVDLKELNETEKEQLWPIRELPDIVKKYKLETRN